MRMCFFIGAIDPLRFFPLLIDDLRDIGSGNRPSRTFNLDRLTPERVQKFHKKSGLQIFTRTIFMPRATRNLVDGLSSPPSRQSDKTSAAAKFFASHNLRRERRLCA